MYFQASLVVQWLRFCPFNAGGMGGGGAWVRSLVRELRSHMPHGNGMAKRKKKSIFKPYSQKSNSVPVDPESEILETPTLSPHTMRNIFT